MSPTCWAGLAQERSTIAREAPAAVDAEKKAFAEKIGFDAYGVGSDMPDPVARAIHGLVDHVHAMDQRVDGMCEALRKLGSDYCDRKPPELKDDLLEDRDGSG